MIEYSNVKNSQGTEKEDRVIAARVSHMRAELGIERSELADAIGIGEVTLKNYENGVEEIPASDLFAISAVTNVPIGYFYGEHELKDCTPSVASVEFSEEATLLN